MLKKTPPDTSRWVFCLHVKPIPNAFQRLPVHGCPVLTRLKLQPNLVGTPAVHHLRFLVQADVPGSASGGRKIKKKGKKMHGGSTSIREPQAAG